MGSFSLFHWLVVLLIILLLFGAGKLPSVMGDLAKGIKNFKAGLKDASDDPRPAETSPNAIGQQASVDAHVGKDEPVHR